MQTQLPEMRAVRSKQQIGNFPVLQMVIPTWSTAMAGVDRDTDTILCLGLVLLQSNNKVMKNLTLPINVK